MPQWTATYPGLNITSADMTYSHGVTPSCCHVVATPLDNTLDQGTLAFNEDGAVVVQFDDCAVFRAITGSSHVRRGIRITVDILDRRWRWRYSKISGKYNVRDSAAKIITDTKKTYKELIELLLDDLGETGYEIDIPDPAPDPPPIDWNDDRVDLELAKLVEFIGCIVHLGQDNLVHIQQIGDGPEYPAEPSSLIPIVDFTPQHYPKELEVVCGPTIYQCEITLEAVGLDYDGEVKLLKDLSYANLIGSDWNKYYIPGTTGKAVVGGTAPITIGTDGESVAISTVYRWYRIKEIKDAGLVLPDSETIDDINNILPLLPRIVTMDTNTLGHDIGPPPFVSGTWLDPFTGQALESKHYLAFELDLERGIVMFREFIFSKDASGYFTEPTITLTAAFHARETKTSGRFRKSFTYPVDNGSNGDSVAVFQREDIQAVNVDGTTNDTEVEADCDDVNDAYQMIYAGVPQAVGKWVGVVTYPLAGNIQQMRWVVNALQVVTYGGKNLEHPVAGPMRTERRASEMISRELPLC